MDPARKEFVVESNAESVRIDRYLADRFPDLSRSRIQRLIRDRWVTVNGAGVRNNFVPDEGARIVVTLPPPEPTGVVAEELPLDILYEDDEMLVVNKAADMVVHPARGNRTGTLVNGLLHHCGTLPTLGGEGRPGIVHRLDKGTSGLLMVAKTDLAHKDLSLQLRLRSVRKYYRAITWGVLRPPEGVIDLPVGRHPHNGKLMSVRKEPGKGKPALSVYRTLEDLGRFSHAEIDLRTGRTHQIRVHFRYVGRMLLGDPSYGGRSGYAADLRPAGRAVVAKVLEFLERQALHAHRLEFKHPTTEEPLSFAAPEPPDMVRALAELRAGYENGAWDS